MRALRLSLVIGLLVLILTPAVGRADSHPVINAGTVDELIDAINDANDDPGTLHEIVLTENGDYELWLSTTPQNALPVISGQVHITGNGATIRRSSTGDTPDFRIFEVDAGGQLHLEQVAVINGRAFGAGNDGSGGGIYNQGTLTLTNSTVSGNNAHNGGGIHSTGTLELTSSTVSGNNATFGSGGIHSTGTLELTSSTVSDNNATFGSGGILSQGTRL